MKADLRKVQVENIEGKFDTVDVSKQLGNAIYNQSRDLGEVELAREMYKTGEIEATEENKKIIGKYIAEFPYIFRAAIEKVFEPKER